MRTIDEIILHCSYTPPSMCIGAKTIRDWHVNGNGWDDIGYHYVITRSGAIEGGLPVATQGAHVRGHNEHTIGICLVGGMYEDGETPDSNFTYLQWQALRALVDDLTREYGDLKISGHRDYDDHKACPCFDAAAWRDNA